jgi:hypothetical protein
MLVAKHKGTVGKIRCQESGLSHEDYEKYSNPGELS